MKDKQIIEYLMLRKKKKKLVKEKSRKSILDGLTSAVNNNETLSVG